MLIVAPASRGGGSLGIYPSRRSARHPCANDRRLFLSANADHCDQHLRGARAGQASLALTDRIMPMARPAYSR
jgi:hypothetical protein